MTWVILIFLAAAAALFYRWMRARAAEDAATPDAGLAIVEFGRAYPGEPIRSMHVTRDGRTTFLRLNDGKTGFMQAQGRRAICHLVEPGRGRAEVIGEDALQLAFADMRGLDGVYTFKSADEAADVALWMLSGYAPRGIEAPDAAP
ncbi:hypothetical protein [Ensifer soli]|uniref:hypothetical protein n=1 Tax=Ciceribacter sp. sgz301302 TaxID=3342379 RepID=UPI0035B97DF5